MKSTAIEQAKLIARGDTEADLEKAQEILMEYLKYHPKDTDNVIQYGALSAPLNTKEEEIAES
ncbi:MAG TPA: hypothetical protein PLU71_01565 [Candidatus Dependentiae bacterium]|nr:hypothetical protein [Candidatus Dependentiae bacterium]HRQ62520.1 hypothetical protein [Candidatus Dependentiae bacterium]